MVPPKPRPSSMPWSSLSVFPSWQNCVPCVEHYLISGLILISHGDGHFKLIAEIEPELVLWPH